MYKAPGTRALFEFIPKTEGTFHKWKRQQKIQKEYEAVNPNPKMVGKDGKGGPFETMLFPVSMAVLQALLCVHDRQQFWAQACAYFYGAIIPIWQ